VLELLRAVAALQPGIITTPPPVALLLGFRQYCAELRVAGVDQPPRQWIEVRSELNVAVYAALQAAGIEIPCDRNNPSERMMASAVCRYIRGLLEDALRSQTLMTLVLLDTCGE
jgi:hypothetical protein